MISVFDMEKQDISQQKPRYPSPIDQVGLDGVELPLKVQWKDGVQNVIAVVRAVVSLNDSQMRGIHMSRIYLALYEFSLNEVLTPESLKKLLLKIISSQKGKALSGRLKISWKGFLKQKSLVSSFEGVRVYPCFYEVVFCSESQKMEWIQGAVVLYSSTCPCSASLSRDLIQEKFKSSVVQTREQMLDWLGKESSIAGTPHAQRSQAEFKVKAQKGLLPDLVQGVEKALAVPVQSAVKREDEKQFAYLNSQNLMYSEDAVRNIKFYLENEKKVEDYWVQVSHIESLHPFDTVAQISKHKNWTF